MSLGKQALDIGVVIVIGHVGIEELGQVTVRFLEDHRFLIVDKRRQIEGRLFEPQSFQRPAFTELLGEAVAHNDRRLAFHQRNHPGAGDVGHGLRRRPAVVDENVLHFGPCDFTGECREAAGMLGELTGLNEGGDKIARGVRYGLAHFPVGGRLHPEVQPQVEQGGE